MTTVAGPRRGLAAARSTAGLVLASALIHLLLLDTSSLGVLAMAAMALACLPCAWHLWRSPTAGVWAVAATMDATMLVLHVQMVSAPDAAHQHAGAAGRAALVWLGAALVVTQLLVAGAKALRWACQRATSTCTHEGLRRVGQLAPAGQPCAYVACPPSDTS